MSGCAAGCATGIRFCGSLGDADGRTRDEKACTHAFVCLDACSAGWRAAGPMTCSGGAHRWEERFFDAAAGLSWTDWAASSPPRRTRADGNDCRRGDVAAADATGTGCGSARGHRRPGGHEFAEPPRWRIPDTSNPWQPQLEPTGPHGRPFQPYGTRSARAGVARLLLHLEACRRGRRRTGGSGPRSGCSSGRRSTVGRRRRRRVRIHHRLVGAARGPADALGLAEGVAGRRADRANRRARYADHARPGATRNATDRRAQAPGTTARRPEPGHGTVWGQTDLYHAVQANLLPRLPLTPGLAAPCRRPTAQSPRSDPARPPPPRPARLFRPGVDVAASSDRPPRSGTTSHHRAPGA